MVNVIYILNIYFFKYCYLFQHLIVLARMTLCHYALYARWHVIINTT